MECVPFLLFLLVLMTPICCDIPLDGPDPEVDEHIRQNFQGHADAFVAGMKDGLAEMQKESEEKAARGEGEADNLTDLLKPESVAQFVANWLPERIRVLLPKEWLLKLIKALTTEGSAIAEVYAGADRIGSSDEFWRELRKKAPTTVELIEDAWAHVKGRWDKFNRLLNDESKQYMEKVKNSGWEWFVRQVAGPFLRLPNDAKTNLTLSLFEAYPLLSTVMSKVMANRTLLEWAGEWYKSAEGQIRTMETNEKSGAKEELNEDNMLAQMKEMFKRMNLGDFDDLMGGMDEEEEEEMREKEEEWEDEEMKEGGKGGEEGETGKEEKKEDEKSGEKEIEEENTREKGGEEGEQKQEREEKEEGGEGEQKQEREEKEEGGEGEQKQEREEKEEGGEGEQKQEREEKEEQEQAQCTNNDDQQQGQCTMAKQNEGDNLEEKNTEEGRVEL